MNKSIEELENEILRLDILRAELVGQLQHVKIIQMTVEKITEYEPNMKVYLMNL